ncbi:MAG: ATP-binding protein [Lancefieldella rimae]|uniref:ATP-binding protein n=1 Tax=Lancefieldella rimae TaxID=1383 RepID=A0A930W419_9ACTN|nr:ATP-binding protein [Lancefieldella rimae]
MPRIVDAQIEQYLRIFGAVEVTGTKWCGKTWSSRKHAKSIIYIDRDENLALAQDAPLAVLSGETPRVLDEWQRVPKLWDYVRHEVDNAEGQKGKWILTGSSTPSLDKIAHSGAGRIGRIRMSPMTLSETGISTGRVSLSELFKRKFSAHAHETSAATLLEAICKGGWPEVRQMSVADAQIVSENYLRASVEQSMVKLGRNPEIAERIIASLARNLSQAVTYKTIKSDMYGSEKAIDPLITDKTISNYISSLESLYLIDPIKGWVPPARSPKRFRMGEKRYFADPSIAMSALGMDPEALLHDWQTFGLAFENLCLRDLLVYARTLPKVGREPIRYYHDDSGLEVDAIIELTDGRWAALEIKTSQAKVPEAVENLKRLRSKLTQNEKARVRDPEFMAVIVGISEMTYQTSDGIYVVPIADLTA